MKQRDHDSSFPGLSTATNLKVITELLGIALKKDHENLRVIGGKIVDVKYSPGKKCILLYRFHIEDRLTEAVHTQMFTAYLLKENEVYRPANPSSYSEERKRLIQTPFFHLADSKIILWTFPYDPVIPWMADLLDEKFMTERLNLMWSHRNTKVKDLNISVLGYTPETLVAILYKVEIENSKSRTSEPREFVGKSSSRKASERLFADAWALWKASSTRIGVPRPEGFLTHPDMVLLEKVPGERLARLIDSPSFREIVIEAAFSLADLHQLRIPLHKKRDGGRETVSLKQWSGVLESIRSDLAQRVRALRLFLIREIESRTEIRGLVHGDFHANNVLADGR